MTSSDKLSALPALNFTGANRQRPRHRSLEASPPITVTHSLPVLSSSDSAGSARKDPSFASLPISNTWHSSLKSPQKHGSASNSSPGKETPQQRVSFDSDRHSLPTFHSVRQALTSHSKASDSARSTPALRPIDARSPSLKQKELPPDSPTSRSPSRERSRAASPLRMRLHNWSQNFHRHLDEQFVPVNPFKSGWRFEFPWICVPCRRDPSDDNAHLIPPFGGDVEQQYLCDDVVPLCCCPPRSSWADTHEFLVDTLPRQIYLHLLLRLPALYFSRVARIFEDAEVSRPDIQNMIVCGLSTGFGPQTGTIHAGNGVVVGADAGRRDINVGIQTALASAVGITAQIGAAPTNGTSRLPFPEDWTPTLVSPSLVRFKNSWESFIDSLLREWKTLNIVSALLLSAILTMFQIPEAASDPLTRNFALFSLICALMSLTYGCVYIVRFGTMRSMYRASRWAEEARKTYTLIWWNVWVLLAMPSVWLAWSMISFVISILSFVWRTGSTDDPLERPQISPRMALAPRIIITFMLFLGLVYFVFIIKTLKRYGAHIGVGRVSGMSMSLSGINRNSDRDLQRDRERVRGSDAGRGTPRQWADLAGDARRSDERRDASAREVEAAMAHRGRERERSGSRSVKRKEAAPGRQSEENEKQLGSATGSPIGLGLLDIEVTKPEGGSTSSKGVGATGTVDINIQIDKGTVSRH
ncbi:hypothetical protein HGRIS_009032 [Hohenbuehelia grisea]|uniref:Uncharacterized protein n=1 Tax=Hohenbuehelia grisea TaxID=104357 RepID=A0ABR3J008_9AGAR